MFILKELLEQRVVKINIYTLLITLVIFVIIYKSKTLKVNI